MSFSSKITPPPKKQSATLPGTVDVHSGTPPTYDHARKAVFNLKLDQLKSIMNRADAKDAKTDPKTADNLGKLLGCILMTKALYTSDIPTIDSIITYLRTDHKASLQANWLDREIANKIPSDSLKTFVTRCKEKDIKLTVADKALLIETATNRKLDPTLVAELKTLPDNASGLQQSATVFGATAATSTAAANPATAASSTTAPPTNPVGSKTPTQPGQ